MNQYPNTTPVALPRNTKRRRLSVYALGVTTLAAIAIPTAYVLHQEQIARAEAAAQVAAAAVAAAERAQVFDSVHLTGSAAYVFDITHGEVLYEKNADTQLPLASITKLMLALAVADALASDDSVTITQEVLATEGESGLMVGEVWTVQDLIDFTLVESSNDGAAALAQAAAAAIRSAHTTLPANTDPTVWRMNDLAAEYNLTQTYFLNPTGLDESESMAGAYGSARDVGHLLAYAVLRHPEVVSGTAREGLLLTSTSISHEAENTNLALGSIPGLIAGKTGFTDLAGGNLVVAFDAALGRPVVAVVLGSTEEARFSDIQQLVLATRDAISLEE